MAISKAKRRLITRLMSSSGVAALVTRADATGVQAMTVIPAAGGASYATTTRIPVYSQTAISAGTLVQVPIPLWTMSPSGTITEIALPEAYDFALALEYPYFQGLTSIPTNTRYQATVKGSGSTVYSYTAMGLLPYGVFTIIAPVSIPARTQYGLWLTHECVAGRSGVVSNKQIFMADGNPTNTITQRYIGQINTPVRVQAITTISNSGTNILLTPASTTGVAVGAPVKVTGTTNYNGTYIVTFNSGTVLTLASTVSGRATENAGSADFGHISTNAVMTATTMGAFTGNALMMPGAVLLPMAPTQRSFVINGNSKQAGDFEGFGLSVAPDGTVYGDGYGDLYGNRSLMRLMWALNRPVAQMSKGSDRDLWRLITGNSAFRNQWAQMLNSTDFIDMDATNEMGALPNGTQSATAYAASTAVALDQVRFINSHYYICGDLAGNGAGTTGASSAPTGTAFDTPYVDGTVTWYYIGDTIAGGNAAANSQDSYGAGWVGQRRQRLRLQWSALPRSQTRYFGLTETPESTSYSETFTSGNYTYTSGTGALSFTVADATKFPNGQKARVTGLSPATATGFFTATTVGNVVTVTVPTGLTVTGTALLSNQYQTTAGQVPISPFASPGTSMRTWINRFLRSTQAQTVLGYTAVIDLAKYVEFGNPTTPGTETGIWSVLTDPSGNLVGASAEGVHEISPAYIAEVTAAMADATLVAALGGVGP